MSQLTLPIRNDLPTAADLKDPASTLSAVLDAAAEIGKVDPSECELIDGLSLGVAYASMTSFLDGIKKRRGSTNV